VRARPWNQQSRSVLRWDGGLMALRELDSGREMR
jgi:hypothetical protein